ncbi:MAG TPA: amidohydrolase family protein [Chthoniobacterales bacterium]
MIIRARTIITMTGPPIDNGAVAISADRIAAVGTFDQVRRQASGEVIDLGEQILMPGLINAHCHLDYTALGDRIPPKGSFSEWVGAINAEKAKLSPEDYLNSIQDGLIEGEKFGTTSIVNFEAFPGLVGRIQSALRIWWLAELIDVRAPECAGGLIDSATHALTPNNRWGLAPHSLYTGSRQLYEQCEEVAAREGVLLATHLAESADEMAMFRDASGPLYQFLQSIGRDMSDCGNETPLARFLRIASGQAAKMKNHDMSRWIVAHLNELDRSDFTLLEQMETKFHIVHCPRSCLYFNHARFAFERLRQLGFNISLGTDSLASNDNLNLFEEMRQFREKYPGISCREIVEMVTVNPARALDQETSLGRISEGYYADLIALNDLGDEELFTKVVGLEGPVHWSMVGGVPLNS